MHHTEKLKGTIFQNRIREIESAHGIRMCVEDFAFLQNALADFCEEAMDKFISGAAEHNESGEHPFHSIDFLPEIKKEAIDLWFYQKGLEYKGKQKL